MSESIVTQLADLPGTEVEPALITNESDVQWNNSFDVIVVGLGAAGVSAAIEAVDRNARVAFIDRFQGGGTSARSGSVMYAGGGTALQARLGVQDDAENMFRYLKEEVKEVVSDATLMQFCKDSPDNFDWVRANGVRYNHALFAEKTSYPVHGYSLYYSGNEIAFAEKAKPAPRGHLADGIKRFTAFGPAFVGPLIKSALQKGVTPIRQTRVTRLLINEEGGVLGVEALQIPEHSWAGFQHRLLGTLANYSQIYYPPAAKALRAKLFQLEKQHSKLVRYRAKGGVILATGGFILNKDMTEKYLPKYRRAMRLGTTGDTGAGIALGVSAGGVAERLSTATAWRFINPPADWPKAALVNCQGRRYVNEALYGATIGTIMMEQHNGEAILVMDKTLFDRSVANLNLTTARLVTLLQAKTAIRIAKSAPTLEELAQICKIDPVQLKCSIDNYNAAARGEITDPLGKKAEDMHEIKQGPYYAINMSAGKGDITSVITLGGLRVCEQTGAVLRENGDAIKGLFAAGRTAIGVASNAYISGLSIADGVFSGRRAGRVAAQHAVQPHEQAERTVEKKSRTGKNKTKKQTAA